MEDFEKPNKITNETLQAFHQNKERIIQKVVNRSMEHTDEVAHHGKDAERLIKSGLTFTTEMLESAMATGEISLLEDQLQWAMDRLPHDGVKPEHILHRFNIYIDIVCEIFPKEQADEINRFIRWMITRHQELVNQEETYDGK